MKTLQNNTSMQTQPTKSAPLSGNGAGIFDLGQGKSGLGTQTTEQKNQPSFQDHLLGTLQSQTQTQKPTHKNQSSTASDPKPQNSLLPTNTKTLSSKTPTPKIDTQANASPSPRDTASSRDSAREAHSFADRPRTNAKNDSSPQSADTAPSQKLRPSAVKQTTAAGANNDRPERPDTTVPDPRSAEALKPIKSQFANKANSDAMVGNNAMLSFVTGRLDRIDPDTIPSIITGSPFIKEAIANQDIGTLMQTPMSINDLCQLFEIDQKVINKATMAGLDPSSMVTPKDFLASLGVDPGRVSTELQLLQEKLPLEGIKPYIERAKALAAQSAKKTTVSGFADNSAQTSDQLADGLQSHLFEKNSLEDSVSDGKQQLSDALALQMAQAMQGGSTQNQAPKNPIANTDQPGAPRVKDPGTIQTTPKSATRPEQKSLASPQDLQESLIANQIKSNAKQGLPNQQNATDSKEPSTPKASSSSEKMSELSDLPKIDQFLQAKEDPFMSLGLDMNRDNLVRTSFETGNISASMTSLEEQLRANGLQSIANKEAVTSKENIRPFGLVEKDSIRDRLNDLRPVGANPEGPNFDTQFGKKSETSAHGSMQDLINGLDVTAGSSPTIGVSENGGDNGSSGFESGNENGGDSSSNELSAVDLTKLGIHKQHIASDAKGVFQKQLEDAEPTKAPKSFTDSLVHHASMLLKEGGGSMRVDVEAPGLGKIDLAINITNDQLDVRILSPHDHVRDIINKELSGLRDGLGQQGISLRNVEIGGLAQGSKNFGAGQGFHGGQTGQQPSYNEMKQYATSFTNNNQKQQRTSNLSPNTSRIPNQPWMGTSAANSRISVRV